jgi:hypothetical protein
MSLVKIEAVLEMYPELTQWGFWEKTRDGFEAARESMTSDAAVQEFERACEFLLEHCERRKSCSRFTSYGWRRRAQAWQRNIKRKRG